MANALVHPIILVAIGTGPEIILLSRLYLKPALRILPEGNRINNTVFTPLFC